MDNKEKKCNGCGEVETKEIQHSLEWEMMKELTISNKRLFVIILTLIFLWFSTIFGFVWYLNQYDFVSYEVQQDGSVGNTFIDGTNEGDITYGAEDKSKEENIEEKNESQR